MKKIFLLLVFLMVFVMLFVLPAFAVETDGEQTSTTCPSHYMRKVYSNPALGIEQWECLACGAIEQRPISVDTCDHSTGIVNVTSSGEYTHQGKCQICSALILSLFIQVAKLLLDVLIMLSSAPGLFWLVVAYVIVIAVRKSIGYKRLEVREIANRQFIESQPLCVMWTATMGAGKTMSMTDMALSCEMMFREKALEKMLEIDAKYPNFPWLLVGDLVKAGMKDHTIYSLTTCRDQITDLRECYESYFDKDMVEKIGD